MKICSIEKCVKNCYGKTDYCSKHYQQIRIHGKILERTIYDPNEIIVENNICRMKLYNRKCKEVAETIFDLKYKSEIEKYKWGLTDGNYVATSWSNIDNIQHNIRLHQAIISMSGQVVPEGYEIDHKNRNRLNNLEENLRVCTKLQNINNRTIQNNNGYKGVSWNKYHKKWKALISINKKRIHLGYFDVKEDAAIAYNIANIKYSNCIIKG